MVDTDKANEVLVQGGKHLRHPAAANNFPSQSEVQQAYDYLSAPYQFCRACADLIDHPFGFKDAQAKRNWLVPDDTLDTRGLFTYTDFLRQPYQVAQR